MTTLRPLGSSLPLGLAGLALASFMSGGLDLGWIGAGQSWRVGMLILATAVPLQATTAIFGLLSRDGPAAGAMGVLATAWLMLGLTLLTSLPGTVSGALGLGLLAAAALLAGLVLAIALSKPLVAAVVLLAAARFAVSGAAELGAPTALHLVAGGLGLAVSVLAAYAAVAFDLEYQCQRPVLPTLRRKGHVPTADPGVRRGL